MHVYTAIQYPDIVITWENKNKNTSLVILKNAGS